MTHRLNPALSFFVTPAELMGWTTEWTAQYHLDSVLVQRYPGALDWRPLSGSEEGREIDFNQFDELVLEMDRFDRSIQQPEQLSIQYPNRLEITLPKLSCDELRQVTIGSVAEDSSYLRIWRILVRDVIAKTKAGMVGVNPHSKATKFYSSVRYTPGSEVLCKNGLQLRPFIGDMTFQIE